MVDVLPEDSGIIRCICSFDHDDNFTIQCERCNAWQHAKCVDIQDEASVPDNYLCPECSGHPESVDRERAKARQKQFLQQQQSLQKQNRRSGVIEDHEEERRKRPGRKRNVELEISESRASSPSDSMPPFDYQYFGIPIPESTWTKKAKKLWTAMSAQKREIPIIPSKELKHNSQLRVTRHKSPAAKWQFGIQAGAVVPVNNLPSNKLVCEVVGEVMLRSEYCAEPTNQFSLLGCPKPGVVFVPGLSFAIDSRRRGSLTSLFLRRSSDPNARLVTRRDSRNNLRVFVYTLKPVKAGTELCLGWHWPEDHPIRRASIPVTEDPATKMAVKTILWILDTDLESCVASENSGSDVDEDWDLANSVEEHETDSLGSNNIRRDGLDGEYDIPALSASSGTTPQTPPVDSPPLPAPTPPPRKYRRAEELVSEPVFNLSKVEEDPGFALKMHVWVPASLDSSAQPQKKRVSLKDYMRKRS